MQDEQIRTIMDSHLFDEEYYLSQFDSTGLDRTTTDFANQNIEDIIAHYINFGDSLHISPNRLFETDYYYENNSDVAASEISAFYHFLRYGWRELRNPHPLFDTQFSLGQMSDIQINPLEYYLLSPPGTLNPHPLVDENYILRQFAEVDIEICNVLVDFLTLNRDDINPSHRFDTLRYLAAYPDLRQTSHTLNAVYHYARYGQRENRWSFDDSASLVDIDEQIALISHIEPNMIPPSINLYDLPFSYSKNDSSGLRSVLRKLSPIFTEEPPDFIYFVAGSEISELTGTLENVIATQIYTGPNTQITAIITDSTSKEIITQSRCAPNVATIHLGGIDSTTDHPYLDAILKLVTMAVITSQCQNIFFSKSRFGWDLCRYYGATLSRNAHLHGLVFPHDHNPYGSRSGYTWPGLRDCLPFLSRVIVDTSSTAQKLKDELRLTEEELSKFASASSGFTAVKTIEIFQK